MPASREFREFNQQLDVYVAALVRGESLKAFWRCCSAVAIFDTRAVLRLLQRGKAILMA